MATGSWPTLLDISSRQINEKPAYIAEMLSQANELFEDLPWIECIEMGGHEFVLRTSMPGGAWRMLNQGVPYSKSTTAKARVGVASLEDYSQVDRWLAEASGDIDAFRESEDVAFLEGMAQTIVGTFWYGNTITTPQEFAGLSFFYNTVNTATAQNAVNVIDGGGTGSNNLSFWLVCWGERTFTGGYPRGSKAGLSMEDKGDVVPGFDSVGNRFEAYTSWFRQQATLIPIDWRYAVRVANVDVTNAGLAGPNALDIFTTFAEMMYKPPTLTAQGSGITRTDAPNESSPGIRPVIYTNRTGRHWMDVQAIRDRNVLLSINDYAGKVVESFRGIPIKISDQLLTSEGRVT